MNHFETVNPLWLYQYGGTYSDSKYMASSTIPRPCKKGPENEATWSRNMKGEEERWGFGFQVIV